MIFFIALGSQLTFGDLGQYYVEIIAFSALILIGNPIIVTFLMGRMRYTKRTSFLSGLTVSQISEFSFILIALGISLNHIPQEILSFITIIGLITMTGSSYMIMHGKGIYLNLAPFLRIFERKGSKKPKS